MEIVHANPKIELTFFVDEFKYNMGKHQKNLNKDWYCLSETLNITWKNIIKFRQAMVFERFIRNSKHNMKKLLKNFHGYGNVLSKNRIIT